ncbi:hypothetical protein D3C76_807940 [compost metagenome]
MFQCVPGETFGKNLRQGFVRREVPVLKPHNAQIFNPLPLGFTQNQIDCLDQEHLVFVMPVQHHNFSYAMAHQFSKYVSNYANQCLCIKTGCTHKVVAATHSWLGFVAVTNRRGDNTAKLFGNQPRNPGRE